MSKKSEEEKKLIPSESSIEATDCTKSKSGTQHDSITGTKPVDGTTGTTQPADGDVFKKMAQEEEDIYGGTTDEETGKIKMLLRTVIIL